MTIKCSKEYFKDCLINLDVLICSQLSSFNNILHFQSFVQAALGSADIKISLPAALTPGTSCCRQARRTSWESSWEHLPGPSVIKLYRHH